MRKNSLVFLLLIAHPIAMNAKCVVLQDRQILDPIYMGFSKESSQSRTP
ncbi:MAG: hypothetical protein AAGF04_00600 [Chlamydiota bacterium]